MTNHDELCDKDGKKDFDVDAFIEYHVGDCSCEHGHECQSCTIKHELKKEMKELRTRVAEQEKLIEWHKTDTHDAMEWKNELQNRLFTLLKASEGMEKALEKELDWVRTVANDSQCKFTRIGAGGSVVALQKALADFRAVKEGK